MPFNMLCCNWIQETNKEVNVVMSEKQIGIADMQCWVFRMAQSKWKMSPSDCAELFKKYDILGFISECYDILHLNGYACVLHDVETLLKNRGVSV